MTEPRPPHLVLLDSARHRQSAELDALSREAVVAVVIQWLETWRDAEYIDPEVIEEAGMLVGDSCHAGVDAVVHEWSLATDTALDHGIGGSFMAGCWRVGKPSIDLETYALLLDDLPRSSEAYASVLWAVLVAVRSDDGLINPRAIAALKLRLAAERDLLAKTGLHPSILASMRSNEL